VSIWTRRDCLRVGLANSAMWIGWPALAATTSARSPSARTPLSLWLQIARDGSITLRSNATEMGQGSGSALAQIVADELDQPWGEIGLEMAPIEPQFFGIWNDYVTGGSASVRGMFDKLRLAGATARKLLITAAARHWGVEEGRCELRPRAVFDRVTQRSRSFGDLVEPAATLTLASPAEPKPRDRWRLIGKSVTRLDLHDKVTGAAMFGIDAGPRDAAIATVRHAPRFGAEPRGVLPADSREVRFVRLPGAVAAVASNYWAARRALDEAKLEWIEPPQATSNEDLHRRLTAALEAPGTIRWVKPEEHEALRKANAEAFANASRVIDARYETPMLAHACMEPMNATASVTAAEATLWVPSQAQGNLRRELSKALSLPEAAITLHTPLLGGGFGRRLESDYGVQAALISRVVGRPVKLLWSREEDLRRDFFRQSAMGRFRAALSADGELLAVRANLAALRDCSPGGMPGYPLPHFLITVEPVSTSLTMGAWRSVECNHNTFFLESFLDEVAHALGQPPVAFRRRLLAERPRALRVLDAAVQASGMERGGKDRHFGVALSTIFDSLCAEVVEISVPEPRSLRVHRVTCALDCGLAVNPDSVRAQMEGGIVMGLSAAMFERISLADGGIAQSNFHDYPILRFGQVPQIHCEILESPTEKLGGAGEPPLPPLAPALTNAIFAATGERPRRLPLSLEGWRLV
jgi:isoquinoline 1-oxidoreductase beta subunit